MAARIELERLDDGHWLAIRGRPNGFLLIAPTWEAMGKLIERAETMMANWVEVNTNG